MVLLLAQPPNGMRHRPRAKRVGYPLVGGTEESRLDGIGLSVVYSCFSGANLTSRVHAVLGSLMVYVDVGLG